MTYTPIYASLLGLIFVALSIRTILIRRALNIAILDNGDPKLTRAIRAHGNFAEYIPIFLILLGFLESQISANSVIHPLMIHLLGGIMIVGRSLHAYGLSSVNENLKFRVMGMMLTFFCLIASSISILITSIWL